MSQYQQVKTHRQRALILLPLLSLSLFFLSWELIAVSYTHLDVYKRQGEDRERASDTLT